MNTEQQLINALAWALLGEPTDIDYRASGTYVDGTRRIHLDLGTIDAGPMIGNQGVMKLACQTLVACPFGGDSCQIHIDSTRRNRFERRIKAPDPKPFENLMEALKRHLTRGALDYKVEVTTNALVVLVTAGAPFTEELRGALSRVIRAAGRARGFVAMASVENVEQPA